MPKIYIDNINGSYSQAVKNGLSWIGISERLKFGGAVFIKPNLTFPCFRKAVMTNPECLEALIIALKDYTNDITVGEADSGGYSPFSMDEVFRRTGLPELAKRYGVKLVNLSRVPSRDIAFEYKKKGFKIPLPAFLLDETGLFITMPVPKMHVNTTVSVSVKNQWGCIQGPALRLELHPYFEKVVYEVNKALRPAVSVVDGKYGLTRSGPLKGDVVELGWLMVADDIYAADLAVCHLMQIKPQEVGYLKYLLKSRVMPSMDSILFNQDYKKFLKEKFYLKRVWTDYPGLLAFRWNFAAYLAYRSVLAPFLHRLLYVFRDRFY